jgi:dihydroorotate dehydrogenase electron transfer subunit
LKQVEATVIDTGEPIGGQKRPKSPDILYSQTITLRCPEIAIEARPGQFVMVDCGEDCTLPRPFSIHRVQAEHELSLYFAVLEDGKGTEWLSRRKKGDKIGIFGPLGNGFTVDSTSHNVLLLAGGIGIAPLVFLAEEVLKQGSVVTLLYGTANEHRYPEENIPSGVKVVAATEDGSVGHRGMITELLPDYIDRADRVFACGPVSMYHYLCRHREKLLRTKPVQVSLEVRMGCGRGICYGCTIKTKNGPRRVCEHGPVFDFDDVIWGEFDL